MKYCETEVQRLIFEKKIKDILLEEDLGFLESDTKEADSKKRNFQKAAMEALYGE